MQKRLLDVVVTGTRRVSPRVREYLLSAADGSALPDYQAGAHVELHIDVPEQGVMVRHYSLIGGTATSDDPAHTWRIAVQREDRPGGSAYLHEHVMQGSALRASHPKNNFPLDRRDGRSLLIAGGIGITPILSMLRSAVRRKRDVGVVYAGRHAADLAYADEVRQLGGDRARVHESAVAGRLDLRALLAAQPDNTRVYVCGPASMVEATHEAAAALGWQADRVRSERFTSGPTGDERAFEVELKRSGRRVQVSRGSTILDALIGAGLHPLHDCRRGECGLCPMTVLEADGPIQHRDIYLSEEEHASQKTLCICVSRLQGDRLVLDA